MRKFSFLTDSGKLSIAKICAAVGMVLMLGIMVTVNVLAAVYSEMIIFALGGSAVDWEGEKMKAALLESAELAEEIASEGILLLKNENNALPLNAAEIANKKINVFGWGASGYVSEDSAQNYSGGFVMSGSGSGNADVTKAKRLLNALEEEGFEYNPKLMQIAKDWRTEKPPGGWPESYTNLLYAHSHRFFRLYEPPVAHYTADIMQEAVEYSDIAMVVFSRLGGEGRDLPTVQYKSILPQPSTNSIEVNDQTSQYTIDTERHYLQLSTEEEALLQHVADEDGFKKIIVVLNACNNFEMGFIENPAYRVDAAISVGALGTSGALAIPQVLKGEKMVPVLDANGVPQKDADGNTLKEKVRFSPSGKTVNTWPYKMKDDPTFVNAGQNFLTGHDQAGYVHDTRGGHSGVSAYVNGGNSGNNYIDYEEGIYLGYRYFETAAEENAIDYDATVQFPFGFGLSYTEFEWRVGDVTLSNGGKTLEKNSRITVEVFVTNTGNWPGQDVVQVYVTAPYKGGLEKAHVVLVDFAKTEILMPESEPQRLELSFDAYDFASYDAYNLSGLVPNGGYVLEGGTYEIKVQSDSHNLAACEHAVTEFTVPAAGIAFTGTTEVTDSLSGLKKTLNYATNYFTGQNADAGVPIDGKAGTATEGINNGAGINVMTRKDFAGTFPTAEFVDGVRTNRRSPGHSRQSGWYSDEGVDWSDDSVWRDHPTTPTQPSAANGGLSLSNEDILMALGKDYNDARWDDLLDQMTLQELYDLVQCGGYKTVGIPSVGKPRVWNFDGPSGLNIGNQSLQQTFWTAFPVSTIMGQTWNKKLAYLMGMAVGAEAKNSDVAGWYAPGVNLHRGAFAGRNYEYFSEDGVHAGIMGAEITLGALQNGLYCYVKHFVANDSETHRGGLRTWLTEQALRELYLKPFEIAVKRGRASGIMSAFNMLGPVWTGGSKPLCTNILRGEWGFQGAVVTDYFSGGSANGMSASQGLRAGNDLWLSGIDGNAGNVDGDNFSGSIPSTRGGTLYFDTVDRSGSTSHTNTSYTQSGRILLRNGVKNILFAHANSYWYANTAMPQTDRFAADRGTIIEGKLSFGWYWIWGILPLDLILLGGIGAILYVVFLRQKKEVTEPTVNE